MNVNMLSDVAKLEDERAENSPRSVLQLRFPTELRLVLATLRVIPAHFVDY
jgi:hypothetical protein